jgi:hypothetical protein
MAITGSDKIFVDVNDEINFVVEKILDSEKERVILVVPQNAIIVSSLVSMKILAKQLAKSKKQLIIVTEDAFGLGLAERSGIVSMNKVSNIQPEMWEAAQIAKENLRSQMEDTKKKLLTDRGILKPEKEEKVEEIKAEESEIEPEAETVEVVSESETEVAEPETTEESPEVEIEEEESIPETTEEAPIEEEIEETEIKGPITRPRREPKVVHVAGFEILAGGDISSLSASEDAMIDDPKGEAMEIEPDSAARSAKKAEKQKPTGGFTGRDWTNYTGDKGSSFSLAGLWPFKRQPTVIPGERRPIMPGDARPGADKRKIAIIALVIVLVLFFGTGFVLANQLNTVEVKIVLQTEQVPVQQQISADVAVTTIDPEIDQEAIVIPAKLITNDQLSISASDKASGEGKSGNKAAGLIDIWNFTDEAVVIPSGTVAQNTTTNLKYIIQTEVSVPAADNGGGSIIDPGIVEDVHIVAETFGEEYNITESGTKRDFKVGDYTTAEIKGQRFNKIEGGTKTTFVAVSQEDVDRVKETLTDTLERQGMNKISDSVPVGYRLIDGTQQFKEIEVKSDPAIGEKADNFSVSLKGEVTALAVSEEDLQKAIEILIANNQKVGSDFEIDGLSDAIIGDVVRDGEKVSFTISSSGSLRSKVTADELKENIAGKSIADADNYLSQVDEIVSHKITYSPSIVPEALRKVPTDLSRIKISF